LTSDISDPRLVFDRDLTPTPSTLQKEVREGDLSTVVLLLSVEFGTMGQKRTLPVEDRHILTADSRGNRELVELLLLTGCDGNATDSSGDTLLLVATTNGHSEDVANPAGCMGGCDKKRWCGADIPHHLLK
jgi:hypothetical protein